MKISEEEAALYDRQIRLWGLESQAKIRASRILMVGLGGMATETVKNLVLAGVAVVQLMDCGEVVSEEDLSTQFFLRPEHVGQRKAKAMVGLVKDMNPRVEIVASEEEEDLATNEDFLRQFQAVIITVDRSRLSLNQLKVIDEKCRSNSIMFFCGAEYGLYGWLFCDMGNNFTFTTETKSGESGVANTVRHEESWSSLEKSLHWIDPSWPKLSPRQLSRSLSPFYPIVKYLLENEHCSTWSPSRTVDKKLHRGIEDLSTNMGIPKSFASPDLISDVYHSIGSDCAPVSAVLGGILSQNIINAISKKGQPLQNWFWFDGAELSGVINRISPTH